MKNSFVESFVVRPIFKRLPTCNKAVWCGMNITDLDVSEKQLFSFIYFFLFCLNSLLCNYITWPNFFFFGSLYFSRSKLSSLEHSNFMILFFYVSKKTKKRNCNNYLLITRLHVLSCNHDEVIIIDSMMAIYNQMRGNWKLCSNFWQRNKQKEEEKKGGNMQNSWRLLVIHWRQKTGGNMIKFIIVIIMTISSFYLVPMVRWQNSEHNFLFYLILCI